MAGRRLLEAARVTFVRRQPRVWRMRDRVEVGRGEGTFWATSFPLTIPGATSGAVTIRHSFLGGLKVLVDGVRARQGTKRAQYLVPTGKGADFEVTLRPGFSGVNPVVVAETNTADVGRRIAGAEWVWVGLPLLLPVLAILGQGGYLDILVGFLAFAANVRIFINDGFTVGERYLTSLGSLLLFAAIYFAVTAMIVLLLL